MEELADEGTYYTFDDIYTFMVLGGFIILNKTIMQYIINVTLMFFVALLLLYLFAMTIITIVYAENRVVQAQGIQLISLIFVASSLPVIQNIFRKQFDNANEMLKKGIYTYKEKYVEEMHKEMRKKNVESIKSLLGTVMKVMYGNCFANLILLPAFRYMTLENDFGGGLVNPYTPLSIYTAYDTKNWLGFSICFIQDSVFFFLLTTAVVCDLAIYLCHEYQLIGELEILNGSLLGVEERARRLVTDPSEEEYMRCLYTCLRECLRHHQAILRFKNEIRHYLGAVNTWCIAAFTLVMSGSVIMFLENPGTNLAILLTALADIFGYFLQCWLGQTVADKSSETMDILYSTPWFVADKKFTNLLAVMITNTKKPIRLGSVVINTEANFDMFGHLMSAGYKLINLYRTL